MITKDKKERLSIRKKLAKEELDMVELFSVSFAIYKSNFTVFILLSMIFGMPLVLSTAYFPNHIFDPTMMESLSDIANWLQNDAAIGFYINIVLSIIFDALAIVSISIVTEGMIYKKRIQTGTALYNSMKFIIPSILTFTLANIFITIGLTLFILPGVILLVLLMFAVNICALRHTWGIKSFKYSAMLIKGRFLKSFMIVFFILLFQNSLPLTLIRGSINTREGLLSFFIANILYYTFGGYFKIMVSLYFLNCDYLNSEKSYVID